MHSIIFYLYICHTKSNQKEMNIENTQAQMRKGILEYCILLIIARQDAYVQDIITQLKASRMLVVEGTVYPLLTRLKNTGLLSYRWEESTQGPPRKYYSITDNGRLFLGELEKSWQELTAAIASLRQQPPAAAPEFTTETSTQTE